jgi:hypothetical protein
VKILLNVTKMGFGGAFSLPMARINGILIICGLVVYGFIAPI